MKCNETLIRCKVQTILQHIKFSLILLRGFIMVQEALVWNLWYDPQPHRKGTSIHFMQQEVLLLKKSGCFTIIKLVVHTKVSEFLGESKETRL